MAFVSERGRAVALLGARRSMPVLALLALSACEALIGADFGSPRGRREQAESAGDGGDHAGAAHGGATASGSGGGGSGEASAASGAAGATANANGSGGTQAGSNDEGTASSAGLGGSGESGGAAGQVHAMPGGSSGQSASHGDTSTLGGAGGERSGGGEGGRQSDGPAGEGGAAFDVTGGEGGESGESGETWACGRPTPELDPDGDGLNDECDPNDDEDAFPDGELAPRDPLSPAPTTVQQWNWPGVVLGDGCVKRAVAEAGALLDARGLATEFPLHLAHAPPELGPYFVRADAGDEQGFFVGGPDATPGAPMNGAEIKIGRPATERADYLAHEFDGAGVVFTTRNYERHLRGNSRGVTLAYVARPMVIIISGSLDGSDLRNVATLTVNAGTRYPSAGCPVGEGRWSLSWTPLWRRAEVDDLSHLCVDEGTAYVNGETWPRTLVAETCQCKVTTFPGAATTVCSAP